MARQNFRSVYFPDARLTLSFSRENMDVFRSLERMDAVSVRSLLSANTFKELRAMARSEGLPVSTYSVRTLRQRMGERGTEPPRVQVQPLSRFENKIIEGDCMTEMHKLPAKSIDMILCDLPYGTTQNKWDSTLPLPELWNHYERIIKDDGVIALTGHSIFTAQLILSNPTLFKYKLTWIKSKATNFLNAKKQPLRRHEDICIFYKKQPSYFPQMSQGEAYNKGIRKDQLTGSYGTFNAIEVKSAGERYPTDVVYFKTAESEGEVYHPTQKPVELGRYLVRTYTKPGDIVLDNTCGSGSFPLAAALEGRRYIGMEKNEESFQFKNKRVDYIDVCNMRIKTALHPRSRAR